MIGNPILMASMQEANTIYFNMSSWTVPGKLFLVEVDEFLIFISKVKITDLGFLSLLQGSV